MSSMTQNAIEALTIPLSYSNSCRIEVKKYFKGLPLNTVQNYFTLEIRVDKENSAFVYFILESNENICFYSKQDSSLKTPYRDILIQGSHPFYSATKKILEGLAKKFTITILKDEQSLTIGVTK